jgi:hypothetical protein
VSKTEENPELPGFLFRDAETTVVATIPVSCFKEFDVGGVAFRALG